MQQSRSLCALLLVICLVSHIVLFARLVSAASPGDTALQKLHAQAPSAEPLRRKFSSYRQYQIVSQPQNVQSSRAQLISQSVSLDASARRTRPVASDKTHLVVLTEPAQKRRPAVVSRQSSALSQSQTTFSLDSALGATQSNGTCAYSSDGLMQPPTTGQCGGPLQRTLLRRNSLLSSNRACSIGQVAYYSRTDGKMRCGECVPGTNGNDIFTRRFVGSNATETSSQVCDSMNQCKRSSTTIAMTSQCRFNQFCSNDGKCVSMKLHPSYGKPCQPESEKLLFDKVQTSVQRMCGGVNSGLRCIQGTCGICKPGSVLRGIGKSELHTLRDYYRGDMLGRRWDFGQSLVRIEALCVQDEYQPSPQGLSAFAIYDPEQSYTIGVGVALILYVFVKKFISIVKKILYE